MKMLHLAAGIISVPLIAAIGVVVAYRIVRDYCDAVDLYESPCPVWANCVNEDDGHFIHVSPYGLAWLDVQDGKVAAP